MRKKIIVVGYHRNAELAERALARHVRKHGAESGRVLARRSNRGIFSKRGRNFTFELSPKRKKKKPGKKLYRFTIAITYPKTRKGSKGRGRETEYYGYYLKNWSGSKKRLSEDREEQLTEVTVQGLEKHLGYPRRRFWFDLESVTSIEQPTLTTDSIARGTWELFSDEKSNVVGRFSSLQEVKEFVKPDEDDSE